MRGPFAVNKLYHVGKSRRFAVAGRSGYQNQTLVKAREFITNFGHGNFFHGWNALGNGASDQTNISPLPVQINTEPANARHLIGKIKFARFIKSLLLLW